MKEWICEEVHCMTINSKVKAKMLNRKQELVRCKDCKWNNGYTGCDKYLLPHGGDWFCADGERKQ